MSDPAATTAPRKRRWRFSLRALLVVVTLFCVWIGSNLPQVRERERIVKVVLSYGGSTATVPDAYQTGRMPFSWRLLGARRFDFIRVPTRLYTAGDSVSDLSGFEGLSHIETAFPEAKVVIGTKLQASEPDHEEIPSWAFGSRPPKRKWFGF